MEKVFKNLEKLIAKDKKGNDVILWIYIETIKNVERLTEPKEKVILSRNSEEIEEIENPILNKKGLKTILRPYYSLNINSPNVMLEKYPEIMEKIGIIPDKKTRKAESYVLKNNKEESYLSFEEARALALKWLTSIKRTLQTPSKINLSGTTEQKGSTVN